MLALTELAAARSKLCADGRRGRVAAVPGVAGLAIALAVMALSSPPGDDWVAAITMAVLIGLNLYAVLYVVLTWRIATTFGATDVSVTTPEMRRIVNLNVIVSFVYNSVIVALLVSILIR